MGTNLYIKGKSFVSNVTLKDCGIVGLFLINICFFLWLLSVWYIAIKLNAVELPITETVEVMKPTEKVPCKTTTPVENPRE